MNTCDTCRHWADKPYLINEPARECKNPRLGQGSGSGPDCVVVEGYECEGLVTGPKFGCSHWLKKET